MWLAACLACLSERKKKAALLGFIQRLAMLDVRQCAKIILVIGICLSFLVHSFQTK